MNPFDRINQLKIFAYKKTRQLTRFSSKQKSFIQLNIEEYYNKRINNAMKYNKDHPIKKKNLWHYGQQYLVIKEAEKMAKNFIQHSTKEEQLKMVLDGIHNGKINLENLPKKAQQYYHENYANQTQESNPVTLQTSDSTPTKKQSKKNQQDTVQETQKILEKVKIRQKQKNNPKHRL